MAETLSAEDLQQQMATLYGTGTSIIWDLYKSTEIDALRNKLFRLIPDYSPANTEELRKLNEKLIEHRQKIETAIWNQRKYCNKDLLMSIIFALVVPPDSNKKSKTYSCHPVFRIRKCRVRNDSQNCCMIFVDENGRVYQDWLDYLDNNQLPKGEMVVPKGGVYTFHPITDKVELGVYKTPISKPAQTALKAIDISAISLGFGAAIIPMVAIFVPVAAPFIIASAVTGMASGSWAIGRSSANLADRGQHEQSISLADRQARLDWLSIAGGAVGLAACGATQGVISYAARGGEISKVTQVAVTSVNATSITVNGVGIANGIVEIGLKIHGNERITTSEILQLSAALVLFTHSIYNIRYTIRIMENSGGTLNKFRNLLGENQRQIFKNFVNEAQRVTGIRTDIIRSTGNIPDYVGGQEELRVENIVENLIRFTANVISQSDLKNCVYHIFDVFQDAVISELITIAHDFLERYSKRLADKLNRVLPFEQVLWQSFKILQTILRTEDVTVATVKCYASQIIRKLLDTYEANAVPMCGENVKCKKCPGYFTVVSL